MAREAAADAAAVRVARDRARSTARRGPRSCSRSATCRARCTARSGRSRPRAQPVAARVAALDRARVAWEYLFWVDLDADPADPTCAAALDELGDGDRGRSAILGTYPRAAED